MDLSFTLIIGSVLAVLGVPWAVGGRRDRARFGVKLSTLPQTDGQVTRIRVEKGCDSGDGLNTTQEFEIRIIEYSVGKARYKIETHKTLKVGDKVRILYNPAQPSDATLAELPNPYAEATGWVMSAVGIALVVLALNGYLVLD
jgi:hypothetical protein